MAKNENKSVFPKVLACLFAFIVGFAGGAIGWFATTIDTRDESAITTGALSIHFMQLGNGKSGDCIYIQAGDNDILVDGGSTSDSLTAVNEYLDGYVTDGILEYVIVTHADLDHIATFAGTTKANTSIFDFYKCKTIIDFPLTDKTTQAYNRYVQKRDAEVENDGAVHHTALACYNNEGGARRSYDLGSGVTLEFLYHRYYEERHEDENNYSVCFRLVQGAREFLFTGDLEEDGEASLIASNELRPVEFFKAGHHGSKTSSNDVLLSVIRPKICVVPCAAGSVQYLTTVPQNLRNSFPTQAFLDRISAYTDQVYVPTYAETYLDGDKWKDSGEYGAVNGNVVITSKSSGVTVDCSAGNTLLKDSEWLKEQVRLDNRDMPAAWA